MIKIKRYRQKGSYMEVFLDCDCGEANIIEKSEGGEKVFECQTCSGQASLRVLRNEATPFTRSSEWVINIDKRGAKRMLINIPVRVDCIAPGENLPTFIFHGIGQNISEKGLRVIVTNFDERFKEVIEKYQPEVTVSFGIRYQHFLPRTLKAKVSYIDYREMELPSCRLGLAFVAMSSEDAEKIKKYIVLLNQENTLD
jgi:hypothetical protein